MTSYFLHGAITAVFSALLFLMPSHGMAQSDPTGDEVVMPKILIPDLETSEGADPFSDFSPFAETELDSLAGGASLDLGDIAVNLSDQTAGVSDTSMSGRFENGDISGNAIEQLSGINSLMFNTGNNVNFQSSIQVNVFVK